MWPLSLLALRQVTNILQVNRNHEEPESIISCELNIPNNNNNHERFRKDKNEAFEQLHSQDHKFRNLFSKHIKKKKRYEIQEIAEVIVLISSSVHVHYSYVL